ncbi:MAG: DUF4301 family protein [Tannerella sp.]|jgi:hypothetical protein|nr:DUF4301 family protein [Tannerella sp.]
MFTAKDLNLFASKGLRPEQVEQQMERFRKGFPFMQITASASVGEGISVLDQAGRQACLARWEKYLASGRRVVKFVPASGAASRMFKDLYAYLDSPEERPSDPQEKRFFDEMKGFAFYEALKEACSAKNGRDIDGLLREGKYKEIVRCLLGPEGLNYGRLPKGLLLFHAYPEEIRTAFEEHLVEGALYAKDAAGTVRLHFTVSPEHEALFKQCVAEKAARYEQRFAAHYEISFSCQKPSTDTIAVDADNRPFRDKEGQIVFRPGGHGALIENLDELEADVIFLKNIDNVSPDKEETVIYKKALAGLLVGLQEKIFAYLRALDGGECGETLLDEIGRFLEQSLCIRKPGWEKMEKEERLTYLRQTLDRPLRVCGMVKNQGEPGGGPFLAVNADGSISPQILESSQIDLNDPQKKALFKQGPHFNPVDLVCAVRDYKGNKYKLRDYVDDNTGFISQKSKDGRPLKALERPGLWNGAMSRWNSVFVEVPAKTFTPVKTVLDLLRPEHQL